MIVEIDDGEYVLTIRLLEGAPVEKLTGALLAQNPRATVKVAPLRGVGTGAKSAPVRHWTGAPRYLPPASGATSGTGAKPTKIEYYRSEIKLLTAEKTELAPAFDAHGSALKSARSALHASHAKHSMACEPEIIAQRIAMHDRIVQASEKWGKQVGRYKEVKGLIETLTKEVERLRAKEQK